MISFDLIEVLVQFELFSITCKSIYFRSILVIFTFIHPIKIINIIIFKHNKFKKIQQSIFCDENFRYKTIIFNIRFCISLFCPTLASPLYILDYNISHQSNFKKLSHNVVICKILFDQEFQLLIYLSLLRTTLYGCVWYAP